MRSIFATILLVVSFSLGLNAQGYYELSDGLKEAYGNISSLKLEEAGQQLNRLKQTEPDNLLIYHIENYIDFFKVFISEDKKEFKRLVKNKDKRLKKIKEGSTSDPFFRFSQAEINLQWALARSKFNDKFTAAQEVFRAYKLLEENAELFPEFKYNYKSLSVIHVLAKSVPGIWRKLLGIKGSIKQGTDEIESLYTISDAETDLFNDEINIIYTYILFYQNNEREKAWKILEKEYIDKPTQINSPLVSFIVSNMAQKIGKTDIAIKVLQERKKDPQALEFKYLDFLLGKSMLYQLDKDADKPILEFVNYFKGRHYLKEAYQKLAWHALVIHDDISLYKTYMSKVEKVGDDLIDEDKHALREAKAKKVPHTELLKARLLYDGTYFDQAYKLLIKKSHFFLTKEEKHEYNYRMGRITQALKNFPEAITYYNHAIEKGTDGSFMSCNAALQIGLILEDQDKFNQALTSIKRCLDMSPKTYKNSLHQKAESAKMRLEEKIEAEVR